VAASEITFTVVATPSEPDGSFSLRYALASSETIGCALRSKDSFHLVVLTSTMMPGSTGGIVRGTLEKASGKKASRDTRVAFRVGRIAWDNWLIYEACWNAELAVDSSAAWSIPGIAFRS
jgi:UDPglucose 6-dehydrogenase